MIQGIRESEPLDDDVADPDFIPPTQEEEGTVTGKRGGKKSRVRAKNKASDDLFDSTLNGKVHSRRCGECCDCVDLSAQALRDSAEDKPEHRNYLLQTRHHNVVMASQRSTRSEIMGLRDLLKTLIEIELENKEKLDYLTLCKKANDLYGSDSTLVGIPWNCIEDVYEGLDSPDKLEAVQRLLFSDAIVDNKVHFMKQIMASFFSDEFRGRGFHGYPQG